MRIVVKDPIIMCFAKDLAQASKRGFYEYSMTRYELIDRILKYNPQLKCFANEDYRGIFDSHKGKFVCGITHSLMIPKFTILRKNDEAIKKLPMCTEDGEILGYQYLDTDDEENKMLARGWVATLRTVKRHGYKLDEEGLPTHLFKLVQYEI